MANLWAFIDESKLRSYLLVAVIFDSRSLPSARKYVRSLRLPGQRRIHFRNESPERKKQVASKLAKLPDEVICTESKNKVELDARKETLSQMFGELQRLGVARVVIERDVSVEAHDRRFIEMTLKMVGISTLEYRHEDPHYEPLLWVADALAWVVSKNLESTFSATVRRL